MTLVSQEEESLELNNPIASRLDFETFGSSPNALSGTGLGQMQIRSILSRHTQTCFTTKRHRQVRLSSTFKDECFAGLNDDGDLGWKEFHRVYGQGYIEGTAGFDGGATGWSADFTGKFADTTLMYFQGQTEIRKIFIKSLIDADQDQNTKFDCQ